MTPISRELVASNHLGGRGFSSILPQRHFPGVSSSSALVVDAMRNKRVHVVLESIVS